MNRISRLILCTVGLVAFTATLSLGILHAQQPAGGAGLSSSSAHQPSHMWWSGRGNLRNNRLITNTLSLVDAAPPVTLTFATYYAIEPYYDFGFVEVATDTAWVPLPITSGGNKITTEPDPGSGVPAEGLTGTSDGWMEASVDLSAYAGQTVRLRFRYWTDRATTWGGWFVDDLTLSDATGVLWTDDVEGGPGGWVADPKDGWQIVGPGRLAMEVWPETQSRPGWPGTTVSHPVALTNRTGQRASFQVSPAGGAWPTNLPRSVGPLDHMETTTFTVTVTVPITAPLGSSDRVKLTLWPTDAATATREVLVETFAGSRLHVYVTNYWSDDGTLTVIDQLTRQQVGVVPLGYAPAFVALSPDGSRAYVTHEYDGFLSVLDTHALTVLAQLGDFINPWTLAVAPDGDLYVLDYGGDAVEVIDGETLEVKREITEDSIPRYGWWDLAVSPDEEYLYVAAIDIWGESLSHPLTVINLDTGAARKIETGLTSPMWVTLSPDGRLAYVSSPLDNGLVAVDATTGLTTTIPLTVGPIGEGAFKPVFSPDGRWAYVPRGRGPFHVTGYPAPSEDLVSVVDVAAGQEVATFVVGGNPVGMAVSSNGLTGFVAAFDEYLVAVGTLPGWSGAAGLLRSPTPLGVAVQRGFGLYLPLIQRAGYAR